MLPHNTSWLDKRYHLQLLFILMLLGFLLGCGGIKQVQWGKKVGTKGDLIDLLVHTSSKNMIADVNVSIYLFRENGRHLLDTTFTANIVNGWMDKKWLCRYKWDKDSILTEAQARKHGKHYQWPRFFFIVKKNFNIWKSDFFQFNDFVELDLYDHKGEPIDEDVVFEAADGRRYIFNMDTKGIRIEGIAPGKGKIYSK